MNFCLGQKTLPWILQQRQPSDVIIVSILIKMSSSIWILQLLLYYIHTRTHYRDLEWYWALSNNRGRGIIAAVLSPCVCVCVCVLVACPLVDCCFWLKTRSSLCPALCLPLSFFWHEGGFKTKIKQSMESEDESTQKMSQELLTDQISFFSFFCNTAVYS